MNLFSRVVNSFERFYKNKSDSKIYINADDFIRIKGWIPTKQNTGRVIPKPYSSKIYCQNIFLPLLSSHRELCFRPMACAYFYLYPKWGCGMGMSERSSTYLVGLISYYNCFNDIRHVNLKKKIYLIIYILICVSWKIIHYS